MIWRFLHISTAAVIWAWSTGVLLMLVVSLADRWNVFSEGMVLYGLHYLPPFWIFLLALPPILVGLLTVSRRLALGLLLLTTCNILLFGDVSYQMLFHGPPPAAGNHPQLRVSTINVRYYSEGVAETLRAIRGLDSDVALLSENVLTAAQRQQMAEHLGDYTFHAGKNGETALLSRLPVLSVQEVDLPSKQASLHGPNTVESTQDNPNRSFMHAVVDVNGVPVHLISVRLIAGRGPKRGTFRENLRWAHYLLETQQKEVDFFLDYVQGLQGPVIFGGDINAPPNSLTVRKIRLVAEDARASDHFFGGFTFPSHRPGIRLDYLFSMNGAQALRSEIHLDVTITDHFPVSAVFRLTPRPESGS